MISMRLAVTRVVRMRPWKPCFTSMGTRPVWSIWAWVMSTKSIFAGMEGQGFIVHLVTPLPQAAVDQDVFAVDLQTVTAAKSRTGQRRKSSAS